MALPIPSLQVQIELDDLERKICAGAHVLPEQERAERPGSPGSGFRRWHMNDNRRVMIRRWLILKGMLERVVLTASDEVLANAFRVGDRYIEKVNAEESAKFLTKSPRKSRAVSLTIDLDDEFAPGETSRGASISELLDQASTPNLSWIPGVQGAQPQPRSEQPRLPTPPTPPTPPAPTAAGQSSAGQSSAPSQIDYAALAATAEAVINPQLRRAAEQLTKALQVATDKTEEALKSELQTSLAAALAAALAEISLTDRLRQEISREAEMVVRNFAEQMLPRRIEIATPEKKILLAAEPRHCKFQDILEWLLVGQHVYIVGPAGTGKTHMFKQLATALGKRQFSIGQALTKYDLSGYKDARGEYIGTLLREALEVGGLVTIDEGDMWAAAALGFLNQPLANGYCAFPDAVIEVHPDFQCIIAANTYGRGAEEGYVGRNPLDAATTDRFAFENVDYDEDLECQLYGGGEWVRYVQRVRKAVREEKLQHVISMRASERCLAGVRAGKSPDAIARAALWRGLAPDTVNKLISKAGRPPAGTEEATIASGMEIESYHVLNAMSQQQAAAE